MDIAEATRLTIEGQPLARDPSAIGELRRTERPISVDALTSRMDEDGYVFFPGFFEADDVLQVRREFTGRLAQAGILEPGTDSIDGIVRQGLTASEAAPDVDLIDANRPLQDLIYGDRMIQLYEEFLGGSILHFTHTWMRAMRRGGGTQVHCDVVFMGRGTPRVFTSWVPYGDITPESGALAILGGSHKRGEAIEQLRTGYLSFDADTYCDNHDEEAFDGVAEMSFLRDPMLIRDQVGGQWLSADFHPGDLVFFPLFTVHGGLDNQSERVRLSTDSRYQLASEPADGRWVGANPPGHGKASKLGLIC
jgi:ectoine hydroxylase-related dioxygenase (phytanoyl-CoA dioxygenase family)